MIQPSESHTILLGAVTRRSSSTQECQHQEEEVAVGHPGGRLYAHVLPGSSSPRILHAVQGASHSS